MLGGRPLGLWKEVRKGNGGKRNEEGKKRYVVPGVVYLQYILIACYPNSSSLTWEVSPFKLVSCYRLSLSLPSHTMSCKGAPSSKPNYLQRLGNAVQVRGCEDVCSRCQK